MALPGDGTDPGGFEFDRAVARLEDVLIDLPFDRALPDLQALLGLAGIDVDILTRDDRLLKVVHEAVVARPFGRLDEVVRTRAELELCILEVEVLTERLVEHADDPEVRRRVSERLAEVRTRLDEVKDLL